MADDSYEKDLATGVFGAEALLDQERQRAALEAQQLVQKSRLLIDRYGVEATLVSGRKLDFDTNADPNSEPVTTIRSAYELTIGDEGSDVPPVTYYIRPVRFSATSEAGEDVYLIFDETPRYETVDTRNINLVRVEVGDKEGQEPGLYSMNGINSPADIGLALLIVDNLIEQEDAIKQEESRQARRAREQAAFTAQDEAARREEIAAQKSAESQERFQRNKLQNRNFAVRALAGATQSLKRNGRTIVKAGLRTLTAAAIVLPGVLYGPDFVEDAQRTLCADRCDIKEYDAKRPTLTEGTVIRIGQTASPRHTFELVQNRLLFRNTVPELGDLSHPTGGSSNGDKEDAFGPDVNGISAQNPADIKYPRQIVLGTSEPKQKGELACETTNVNFITPNDGILAATDMSAERTRFIKVTVKDDSVSLCWRRGAKELNRSDDPRLVFQRLSPAQVAQRQPVSVTP